MRNRLKHIWVIVLFMLDVSLFAQHLVRGPYLQNPTASSIVVRWRTDSLTDTKITYGYALNNWINTIQRTGLSTEHSITLYGLKPATKYYYKIGNTTSYFTPESEDFYFKTFPIADTIVSTHIWAIGDFGRASDRQRRVRDAFLQYDSLRKTDVWLWLGDNAYNDGTDIEYQVKVFDTAYAYGKIFQHLPFHPAPGNHDYNSFSPLLATVDPHIQSGTYLDVIDVPVNGENGGVPSGQKQFYSFNHGNVHFVSFNSELASLSNPAHDWLGVGASADSNFAHSPMRKWLEEDLQQNEQQFTIVYFHQVPHTAGSHISDSPSEIQEASIRKLWCPLFEKYGVDIVLGGHSHVYERSFLMNGFFGDWSTLDSSMILNSSIGSMASGKPYQKLVSGQGGGKGTVYVVCGNAGSSTTSPPFNCPIMLVEDGCDECVGSLLIDVKQDTLTSRYLKADGTIGDEFSIVKTNIPTTLRDYSRLNVEWDLYPNPVSHSFVVSFRNKDVSRIALFDANGERIWSKDITARSEEQHFEFDIREEGIPEGTYWLTLESSKETSSKAIYIR